jgi:hypothetical protein
MTDQESRDFWEHHEIGPEMTGQRGMAALSDEAIDLSDIPERLDWAQAQVGRFYRPIKQA